MLQRHPKLRAPLITAFALAELSLAVLLQCSHGKAVVAFSYAAVVLACAFCALCAARTPSYLATQLALVCAVFADYFLVVLPEIRQLPAMLFFSVTQLLFFLRLFLEDPSPARRRVHTVLRASLSAAAILLTLAVLGEKADAVALVSMFYYANLVLNAVFSFLLYGKRSLLGIGFVLFLCCDTVVGLNAISPYLTLSHDSWLHRLINPGFNLAWVFYVPCLSLLCVSPLQKRR